MDMYSLLDALLNEHPDNVTSYIELVGNHCPPPSLLALSRCSKLLNEEGKPLLKQAETKSEKLLCQHMRLTREALDGSDTVTWPAGLPAALCRHLGAWTLPGKPLRNVTTLQQVPLAQVPLCRAIVLNLSEHGVTGELAMVLAVPIAANATLTKLNLDGFELNIPQLRGSDPVQTLDLSSKGLGVASGVVIGKLLEGNATLTSLDLQFNKIGAEGGIAIAEALKVNASLTKLDLRYNSIGDEAQGTLRNAARASLTIDM